MLASDLLAEPVVAAAVRTVSVPRAAPADSFVLHAPLELLARIGLLERVRVDQRPAVLARIGALAEEYDAWGPPVEAPDPVDPSSVDEAVADLVAALAVGDLDVVDAHAAWLGDRVGAGAARRALAGALAPSLAAAGHAPIGLHLLERVGVGTLPTSLLRGTLRELARHPAWRVSWFEGSGSARRGADGPTASLEASLRSVPHLGIPGSTFIQPLMASVESAGAAEAAIGPHVGSDPSVAARTLTRAACWSMLHDDPAHAPYGWTHCLTLPQAVLSLAPDALDPATAIAVAGTHVVGFRAALGVERLGSLADDAGGSGPPGSELDDLLFEAAVHPDAHVAKYVLACRHAAEDDPAWSGAYGRAAERLVRWWREVA